MDNLSAPTLLFRREIGTILQFTENVLDDLYNHENLYEHSFIFEAFTELISLCRKSKSNKILVSTIYLDMHPAERSIVTLSRRLYSTMPKYSQKDLLYAVYAVGNGMAYRKASAKYNVPVMTIQNRVSGQVDDLSHAGRPRVIPSEIEREIVDQIKRAGNMVNA